uniref:Uncharacterized protein n=1 Tax=Lacrimia lanifica TaxID=2016125 RepID=A0A6G5ZV39_9EUGL|nr:hypothetical protein [Lacrimia lanifica]
MHSVYTVGVDHLLCMQMEGSSILVLHTVSCSGELCTHTTCGVLVTSSLCIHRTKVHATTKETACFFF